MWKRTCLILSFFFISSFHSVDAWDIEDYQVSIKLNQDNFIVTEKISADFGFESKHGIYRDIPTSYQDERGNNYAVRFQVLDVSDEDQKPRDYTEENSSYFKRIKIGNAHRTISGRQTYVISYQVWGAVLFLPDHDEIYWNATGNQWDVAIRHVHVDVALPQSIPKESLKAKSYSGEQGSVVSNAKTEIVNDQLIAFDGGNYSAHEGLTIVVGLPKGILVSPPVQSPVEYLPYPVENTVEKSPFGALFLSIPFIVFFGMFHLWQRFGKDPQLNKSIVVEYQAPDGLSPSEVGTLIDGRVDQRDISSTIIDLAIRGYLKIVPQEKVLWSQDYSLAPLKVFHTDPGLKSYEKIILNAIFGVKSKPTEVKLSELENEFYTSLNGIENSIKTELKVKKYLGDNPAIVRTLYAALGGIVFFTGLFLLIDEPWIGLAALLSGLIIFLFGLVMPKRTLEGTQVLSRILGFKEFLQRTEKDQIQRAEQLDIFERMLPYAICLGMSTKWAKKFDGLYTQPPAWFSGNPSHPFLYNQFIHDLDHSLNRMGSSFYSAPQSVSSGGGFSSGGHSGGGFGGGGGGSW